MHINRTRQKKKRKSPKRLLHVGKFRRCAACCCALLFGFVYFCQNSFPFGVPVYAEETVTEESIQEKEEQIEQAKEEQEQVQNSISDLESLVEELEALESDLTEYVTELDAQLTEIQGNIDNLNAQIEETQEVIEETQEELEEAEDLQEAQYEDMKERLRFIYEKGDTYYIEILMSASSFGDLLNKSYYVEQLSSYDEELLERLTEQTELVEKTKEALEEEEETLNAQKEAVEEEEANVEALLAQKQEQLSATSSEITESAATIEEYEQQLSEQTATIEALEASVEADKEALAAQEEANSAVVYTGGVFVWPCPSYTYISSDYGYREHPIYGTTIFHSGIDMAADSGAAILAAADGTVVAASYESTMGNYIMINHGSGLYTIYMHASALYVSTGQTVSAGDTIAAVGSTGNSTGPHLHFSVRLNGSYVNPWSYLTG